MYAVADGKNTRCTLFRDFAPYSFEFLMERSENGRDYERWFNGGLIYQGPDVPADGSAPSLTVSIDSKRNGWFVHA